MDRTQKESLVGTLHEAFADTAVVVITHYSGMTVAQLTDLRRKAREAGASFKVTKNRLTRLALAGTPYQGLEKMFAGPTAVAFSKDPVAAAKLVVDFAKTNDKLIIVGGATGQQKLTAEGVKSLAALPSLDELRARLVGMMQTPATRVAAVLQAPAGQLARVMGAYARKDEAA